VASDQIRFDESLKGRGEGLSQQNLQSVSNSASSASGVKLRATLTQLSRTAALAFRNVFLGGNLISLRLINSPRLVVHYATECLFLYHLLRHVDGLPQVHVWQGLVLSDQEPDVSVTICAEAAQEWFRSVPYYGVDLIALCLLSRMLSPRVIFEIGTLRGSSALHLAMNSPSAKVYTLDLPPSQRPSLRTTFMDNIHVGDHHKAKRQYFRGRPEEERVHCLFGDSAAFDLSPFFGKVDLFFIDGAHSYEYVRNDTIKALQCMSPGGVIAWHDYGRSGINGVTRWLHELRDSGHEVYRIPGGSLAYMRVSKGPTVKAKSEPLATRE
jgi:predicted O-methyltransferase YrrM